jgi:acetolactate synthase regulatory subunit
MLCAVSTMCAGSALTVSLDVVITSASTAYTCVHVLEKYLHCAAVAYCAAHAAPLLLLLRADWHHR